MGPVTVSEAPAPFASSDPAVIARPPLIVEFAATMSAPPVMDNGSLAITEWTDWLLLLIVIVGVAPLTLITTSSPGPGTFPVLQLLPTLQFPLALDTQSTVERSCRGSRPSKFGQHRRHREGMVPARRARDLRFFDMVCLR